MAVRRRVPGDYLRIMYRRRWSMLLAFLIVFSYGTAASFRRAPVYGASAQLLTEPNAREAGAGPAAAAIDDAFYQTQTRLVQSRVVVWRAIETLGMSAPPPEAERISTTFASLQPGFVEQVALLIGAPPTPETPVSTEASWRAGQVEGFLKGVTVARVPSSHLVDVRYRSPDPVFAARGANALANAFVDERQSVHSEGGRESAAALLPDAPLPDPPLTAPAAWSGAELVDPALVPAQPISANHSRDALVFLMAGCLVALVLGFGVELLDSRLKTPDDIKAYLELPFLGMVPSVKGRHHDGVSPLLQAKVPPIFAESLRSLRTSVVFSDVERGRTLLVTSTAPSEGKTVVSTNLASALAQADQRTLVIDGDMRRPRVHEVFGFGPEPGLSNVLTGTVHVHAAIRRTSHPNLSVLPAGALPPNPAELAGSTVFHNLIEYLSQEYDWIIIDAPPVMAVADAAVMSHDVAGVVFVVGAEMTPRRNAQTALEQLRLVKAPIVGAVLNRVNLDRHAYYYAPYHRKDYTRAYVAGR